MPPMSARTTTPPATPPAIAPVFDDFFPEEELSFPGLAATEVPEEGDPATREAVVAERVVCPVTAVPPIAVEAELPPITEPASISGESRDKSMIAQIGTARKGRFDCLPPTPSAEVASQRFSLCRSRRGVPSAQ